ncbi:phosphate/phosphite/phosphonate ABC transporter substrate-binding protein [Pseudacidovorax sp. NFM-22]|uniref:phosphate/phosphite/phosphonate ABC transporter substrate-binding protein n=1 Tax=Pseudacidovorax sp. NFM-22 TaxID=2744469 RepID=UPI001F464BFA|nr:phosphate/phosphite/phosphonate ABC transporter substrate-binding protein [Pseudacidovorax sp. NFM-22]
MTGAEGRRRLLAGALALGAGAAWASALAAGARPGGERAGAPPALVFGLLPMGDAVESRRRWEPLLLAIASALRRPVTVFSAFQYDTLDRALQHGRIDFALLSGKMALDAVTSGPMQVLAQVRRRRDPRQVEHRALLLGRLNGGPASLDAVLQNPERWHIARGDRRSVSGFIVPQSELFLPHGIDIETSFKAETVGNHQDNALAVANGDADVATTNSTDFERFQALFPTEAGRLQVLWTSLPTPPAQIVVRRDLPAEQQAGLRNLLLDYGRAPGADAERAVLRSLQADLGYEPADDSALLEAARMQRDLALRHARLAQWVSEDARQGRIARVEREYQAQVRRLGNAARD